MISCEVCRFKLRFFSLCTLFLSDYGACWKFDYYLVYGFRSTILVLLEVSGCFCLLLLYSSLFLFQKNVMFPSNCCSIELIMCSDELNRMLNLVSHWYIVFICVVVVFGVIANQDLTFAASVSSKFVNFLLCIHYNSFFMQAKRTKKVGIVGKYGRCYI